MNDCYCKAKKVQRILSINKGIRPESLVFMSMTQVVIDLLYLQPGKDLLLKKIGLTLDENIICIFDKNSPHRIHVHTKI